MAGFLFAFDYKILLPEISVRRIKLKSLPDAKAKGGELLLHDFGSEDFTVAGGHGVFQQPCPVFPGIGYGIQIGKRPAVAAEPVFFCLNTVQKVAVGIDRAVGIQGSPVVIDGGGSDDPVVDDVA